MHMLVLNPKYFNMFVLNVLMHGPLWAKPFWAPLGPYAPGPYGPLGPYGPGPYGPDLVPWDGRTLLMMHWGEGRL